MTEPPLSASTGRNPAAEVDGPAVTSNKVDLIAVRAGQRDSASERKGGSLTRLAWLLTITWLVAIGSYMAGFVSWSGGIEGGTIAMPPVANLLFFVVVCIAPVSMIWGTAALASRSGGLSAEIREQTETAARIAEELSALHDVANEQRRLLIKAFDTTAQELEGRFETMSTELVGTVDRFTDNARTTLTRRGEALDHALVRLENRIDAGLAERLSKIEKNLVDSGVHADQHIERQGKELRSALAERGGQIDRILSESQEQLKALIASRLSQFDKLADQDGGAAADGTSDGGRLSDTIERLTEALDSLAGRLDALDEKTNTLLERASQTAPAEPEISPEVEALLDLTDLDEAPEGSPVEWAEVLGTMSLGTRKNSDGDMAAPSDPVLKRALELGRKLQSRIAADGLFVQDLTPDQASPESWELYAKGERDPMLADDLAGISDPVAAALIRTSLKGDTEFRKASEAYVAAYQKLIARAVDEGRNGADLIALAETTGGRIFTLLGNVIGAFKIA
ncbi:MAG: hypothetical protein AAGE80_01235 [Pseudomonadota bacterium]